MITNDKSHLKGIVDPKLLKHVRSWNVWFVPFESRWYVSIFYKNKGKPTVDVRITEEQWAKLDALIRSGWK